VELLFFLSSLKSLPRIDALGSRQLLLFLIPKLCTVDCVINTKEYNPSQKAKRIRALDVGAGIGRVTRDVLLHLVHDVVLVEPVPKYIGEAWARGKYHQDPTLEEHDADFRVKWKGIRERATSVTFIEATHQSLDPSHPLTSTTLLGRVGYTPQNDPVEDIEFGFDIVWCQWSLGHLRNADLILFLRRAKACLRDAESVIIVKENICVENEDIEGGIFFDDQDSSLTRFVIHYFPLYT
jgi:protein N-terminal methyltransferase